jgi:hypothetical protein
MFKYIGTGPRGVVDDNIPRRAVAGVLLGDFSIPMSSESLDVVDSSSVPRHATIGLVDEGKDIFNGTPVDRVGVSIDLAAAASCLLCLSTNKCRRTESARQALRRPLGGSRFGVNRRSCSARSKSGSRHACFQCWNVRFRFSLYFLCCTLVAV